MDTGPIIRAPSRNRLIIAFHGYGQVINPKPLIPYFDFVRMSHVIGLASQLNCSLWLPQAPRRDWTQSHVDDWPSIEDQARFDTGSVGDLIFMGLSDGGHLVHRLLTVASNVDAAVIYSAPFEPPTARPRNVRRVILIHNARDIGPMIRSTMAAYAYYVSENYSTDLLVGQAARWPYHRWDPNVNSSIARKLRLEA